MEDQEKPQEFAPRLDQIETRWSLLRKAHEGTVVSGSDARNTLVMRYSPAIRSYVRAVTRNEEEADELAQDVVVRILKGDFAGADPDRGRFRDLLKVAVRNMVRNYWDKKNRRRTADLDVYDAEQGEVDAENDPWLESWRNNLLEITWARLEQYQVDHDGSVAYSVLKLRAEHPQDDSTQLAEKLSESAGRPIKPDTTRQQLRRARVRFAEFLVEEIADGLDQPDPERVQQELISLGLFEHIKDALPKEWKEDNE